DIARKKPVHRREMLFCDGKLQAGQRVVRVCDQRARGRGVRHLPVLEGAEDGFAGWAVEARVVRDLEIERAVRGEEHEISWFAGLSGRRTIAKDADLRKD